MNLVKTLALNIFKRKIGEIRTDVNHEKKSYFCLYKTIFGYGWQIHFTTPEVLLSGYQKDIDILNQYISKKKKKTLKITMTKHSVVSSVISWSIYGDSLEM